MKLYKFRPLGSCQDLERAQEILNTGKFWCSRFWELNDPMEGVYWFNAGTLNEEFIHKLYGEKSKILLCSFSGEQAFGNPLMWGYYANGFKGIAIEIEVNGDEPHISKMNYDKDIATITNDDGSDDAVKRILTTKLDCWKHEKEYRYIHSGSNGLHKIGQITAVYFGKPFKTTVNWEDAQRRPRVRQYLCHVESLKETANEMGFECIQVDLRKGRVVKSPSPKGAAT